MTNSNDNKYILKIEGKNFTVEDDLQYITLADSFLLNKIGKGHGEAKLYIGQENKVSTFFGKFDDAECFLLKKDFFSVLLDSKTEYEVPQQNYRKKSEMIRKYLKHYSYLATLNEILWFKITRVNVEPPRIYIQSNSPYFKFLRNVGLPNISYLSVLKIKEINTQKIQFYFRIFIDYTNYQKEFIDFEEKAEIFKIENSNLTQLEKQTLSRARIGQGEYREKLLQQCLFCPFTLINDERLLVASHIKPWVKSNEQEKIDPNNGFIFTPTFDRLFDRGFISFEGKRLLVSPWLSPMNQKRLDIYQGKLITNLPTDPEREKYLIYHRKNIFKA
jgi:putative restriction endonuclease